MGSCSLRIGASITQQTTGTLSLNLDAYLDDFEWRFNDRKNPYLFRDTILKLIASPNLEYKELTARQNKPAA